ncbi:10026_t:CDS:2 [Ambispora gerdemannii]|uniref:10026_t:CDS:1 n=1 Tax=Ambispora gerdemannii TaxID=144530 RepID=A0A9N9GZF2_9GLOM|nr:10026_t:CDS:2 [Ambispora gerdemannii]
MSFHAYLQKVQKDWHQRQIYSTSRETRFLCHAPWPEDIIAVVAAIYEPSQEHQTDGLSLNLP